MHNFFIFPIIRILTDEEIARARICSNTEIENE